MKTANRVVEIDILRGFALFGVLLVNLTMMDSTIYGKAIDALSGLDRIAYWGIRLFAQGKFYTIFSFLFGIGFYYFSKGTNRYGKRLKVLFVLGMFHAILVWYGDILHVYAVAGWFLLKNHKRSNSDLIRQSIVLFTYTILMTLLLSGNADSDFKDVRLYGETVYQTGSYIELLWYRVNHELPIVFVNLLFTVPKVLILFNFGLIAGRLSLIPKISLNHLIMKKLILLSGLGFVLVIIGILVGTNNRIALLVSISEELSTYLGCLFYSLVILGLSKLSFMHLLAPMGRMALSNYLTQTLFFTFILGNYGASLFGRLSYSQYLPVAIVFYMLQVLVSNLWMKQFKSGPFEAFWRKLY